MAGSLKLLLAAPLVAMLLSGCAVFSGFGSLSSRDCLARAMYFESNRSSEDGMLAVGTVVMNRVADRVLHGARHPTLSKNVKHFHTAGYSFPYDNMYYVLEAGGNAFYEKRKAGTFTNNPFKALAFLN